MMMNNKPMSQQAQRLISIKNNATNQAEIRASMQVDKIARDIHQFGSDVLKGCETHTDIATRIAVENTVRMMMHKLNDLVVEHSIRGSK